MSMTFKYGASFPRRPSVPKVVPVIALPEESGRRETDITVKIIDAYSLHHYEQGLVEGRRQILTWMKEALDMFIPMAAPTAVGALLIEGLRSQIDKYLLSGGNPLEKTEESSGG